MTTSRKPPADPMQQRMRGLPSVEKVLDHESLRREASATSRGLLADAVRTTVDRIRRELRDGTRTECPGLEDVVAMTGTELARLRTLGKVTVLNATGTLLHTNLGRARIPDEVASWGFEVARSCVDLEVDLATGKRGARYRGLRELLARLVGAEDALAVNNNAAAVLLVVDSLARGREVVISRGELIEIGGSFRLPEIIRAGGARMVEVGTTNRTHPADYEAALGSETGLVMKAHTSNYRIVGFSKEVPSARLVALARARGIPVFEDLGSGCLVDLSAYGLPREPTVGEVLASGVDLVSFSTDKLLGGPQGGLIAGRAQLVEKLRKNHLLRALRMGKVDLAMVERTLALYLEPGRIAERIPLYESLARSPEALRDQAERIVAAIAGPGTFRIRIEPGTCRMGGGACPTEHISSLCVVLDHPDIPAQDLAGRLRAGRPPVLARIQDGAVRLDMRTLAPGDVPALIDALEALIAPTRSQGR